MSKKISFFEAFGISVFLGFVSLQVVKDVLPRGIRNKIQILKID